MFVSRVRAVRSGRIDFRYFKTYEGETPVELRLLMNNFQTQFEMPVLFFIACLAAIQMNCVTTATLAMAYVFFASRLIHCYVHVTSNKLAPRAWSYFLGVFMVLGMWIQIVVSILSSKTLS